ncbi:hypothetical protein SDC9_144000 [bioreactor metagenome]|uniref:Uncharacterized protein n=1 Tax=bioreactor metagenome TaxID=1076179 RepID=A0A645E5Q0_9ZZZZ
MAVRHIEPAFVHAERLYQIRVSLVDRLRQLGVFEILLVLRGYHDEVFTRLSCLPVRHAGLHACSFGQFRFRKYDAVSLFGRAAYRHCFPTQLRIKHHFHRSVKAVQIAVKYRSHVSHLLADTLKHDIEHHISQQVFYFENFYCKPVSAIVECLTQEVDDKNGHEVL